MTTSEPVGCFVFIQLPNGTDVVCGRLGRWANRGNLLSESARFGFPGEEATEIIEAQRQVVATRWRERILERGGTEADLAAVASVFCYPGFDYE